MKKNNVFMFLFIGVFIGVILTISFEILFKNNSNESKEILNSENDNIVNDEKKYFANEIEEPSYDVYESCDYDYITESNGKIYLDKDVVYTCKSEDCGLLDVENFFYCNKTNSLVAIYDGDKNLLLNFKDKKIVMEYDEIYSLRQQDGRECFNCYAYFRVQKGDKEGIASIYGDILVEPIYERIGNFRDTYGNGADIEKQLVTATKDGKVGVINIETGKIVIPFEYEYIKIWEKHYVVRKNGKETLLDLNGNVVLDGDFDYINDTSGIIFAEKDDKIHFYDYNYELLTKNTVPIKETAMNNPSTGYSTTRIDDILFIKVYDGGVGEFLACYKLSLFSNYEFEKIDCESLEKDYCIFY